MVIPDDLNTLTAEELVGFATLGLTGGLLWPDVQRGTVDHWLAAALDGIKVHSSAFLAAVLAAQRDLLAAERDGPPLRVLLADADAMARAGMRAVLDAHPRFEVIGETAQDTVAAAVRLQPEILVFDPSVRGRLEPPLVAALRSALPHCRLCIYTAATDVRSHIQAMVAGASMYLLKGTEDHEKLIEALLLAGRSEFVVLGGAISARALEAAAERGLIVLLPEPLADGLTAREAEVVNLLVAGLAPKEIAARLYLSERTVEEHRRKAATKLHANTREQFAINAVRAGIVRL